MFSKALTETQDGVLVDILVVPNSKDERMEWDPWRSRMRMKVCAKPTKGKANEEVLEFFSCAGPSRIVRGHHSKEKTVLVKAPRDAVMAFLASHLHDK